MENQGENHEANTDICDEPIGRSLIAEIVAFEMTRKVVEAKYKNCDDIDAAQIYHLHQVSLSRYLRKCQSLLHLS